MLDQVLRWVDITAMGVDALLLLRVLMLRLHRVYIFITLYCTVTLLLDGAVIATASSTTQSERLFLYSRFLMTAVFPLAVWDVFEDTAPALQNIRRAHVLRLVSGLTLTSMLALMCAALFSGADSDGMAGLQLGAFLIWAATISACLMFLWNMQRMMRREQIAMGANTRVWWTFFILTLFLELATCLLLIIAPKLGAPVVSELAIALDVVGMGIVLWCVVKLRAVAPSTEAQSADA